jgi:hypothetical protein
VHAELTAALVPILRDLDGPAGVRPSVRDEPWQDHPGSASAMVFGPDGAGMGVWITVGQPAVAQIVLLADQVQQWAVESLWWLGRPATWPHCPHHPDSHPLLAAERSGRAMWTCPVLGIDVREIGAEPGYEIVAEPG